MDWIGLIRAAFALSLVVGLILVLAYGLRRYAPSFLARLQGERLERRMQVVETLVLDPARRLVLVRLDQEERLILLGDGQELLEPRLPGAAPTTTKAQVPAPLTNAPSAAKVLK